MGNVKWRKTRAREFVSLCGRFVAYTFLHAPWWCLEDLATGQRQWVRTMQEAQELAEQWNTPRDRGPDAEITITAYDKHEKESS